MNINEKITDLYDDYKILTSLINESKIIFNRLIGKDEIKNLINVHNFTLFSLENQFTFNSSDKRFKKVIDFFSTFDPFNIKNNQDFFVEFNNEILNFFQKESCRIFTSSIPFLNALKKRVGTLANLILKKEVKETKHQLESKLIFWLDYLKQTHHQEEKLSKRNYFMQSLMCFTLKTRMWKLADNLANHHAFTQDNLMIERSLKWHCISTAMENRKFRFLSLLLKNEVPSLNPVNYTPLHLAAFDLNNQEMISFLEKWKFTDDSISLYGFTPSYIADALETEFPKHLSDNSQLKKEIYDRKLLANIWGANRKSDITSSMQTKTFNLEGNMPSIGPKEISRFFELFTTQYGQESPLFLKVKDVLHNDIRTYTPAKRVLKEFHNGEILNFPTGYGLKIITEEAHIIQLLFVDKYFLICNRGLGSKVESIIIIEIDRSRATLTLEHIEKLKKGWWTKLEGEQFIYDKLPVLAGAVEDQSLAKEKFKKIIQKTQSMGNCWWISSMTGVFGLFLTLMTLEQEKKQQVSKELIYDQAKTIYKKFTYFCKIAALTEYLGKKIDEKKENSQNLILPDTDLLKEVLLKFSLKHYWKDVNQASKIMDLTKEFDFLYQTELSLFLMKCLKVIESQEQKEPYYQMLKDMKGKKRELFLKEMINE